MTHKLLQEIINGVWMIDKQTADGYLPSVFSIVKGDVNLIGQETSDIRKSNRGVRTISFNNGTFCISEYGEAVRPEDAPDDSIAVINLTDVITKYDQECGPAGMLTKIDLIARVDNNAKIKGIILNIDSGGGEGYAAMAMQQAIKNVKKPIFAYVNDIAASAAYYIASACDGVFANTSVAKIGSIGTYVTIADYTEYFNMQGIKLIEIYASKSKDKNKGYYDALDGDNSIILESVNKFNDQFLSDVKRNRKSTIDKDVESWGTGKLFFADEALKLGLIDGVITLEELANNMLNL